MKTQVKTQSQPNWEVYRELIAVIEYANNACGDRNAAWKEVFDAIDEHIPCDLDQKNGGHFVWEVYQTCSNRRRATEKQAKAIAINCAKA